MKKNSLYGALDFPYVLLEQYKSLAIKEDELAVILMVDHLLKQGNKMVTSDSLALKMNIPVKDIERILSSLLKRGLVDYVKGSKGMKTTLDPLKERVYGDFSKRMEKEEAAMTDAEKAEEIGETGRFAEEKLGRSLTPLEQSTIQDWFLLGYGAEDIKNAFLDCLSRGTRSFKAVERQLKAFRRRDDFAAEKNSAVGESYDRDIKETFELAKKLFGDD